MARRILQPGERTEAVALGLAINLVRRLMIGWRGPATAGSVPAHTSFSDARRCDALPLAVRAPSTANRSCNSFPVLCHSALQHLDQRVRGNQGSRADDAVAADER